MDKEKIGEARVIHMIGVLGLEKTWEQIIADLDKIIILAEAYERILNHGPEGNRARAYLDALLLRETFAK